MISYWKEFYDKHLPHFSQNEALYLTLCSFCIEMMLSGQMKIGVFVCLFGMFTFSSTIIILFLSSSFFAFHFAFAKRKMQRKEWNSSSLCAEMRKEFAMNIIRDKSETAPLFTSRL